MLLKILGCGTSVGVPVPACDCPVCTSTDPRNARDRTSAVIQNDNGRTILIDSSPDLRHQALKWRLTRVDAVVFTHAHADHIFGLDDLRCFNFQSGLRIPCFGTPGTLREIRKRFDYLFKINKEYEGGALAQLDLVEVTPGVPFLAGGCEIMPFTVLHGKMEVTGFKVGELAYATDCNAIPEATRELLRGVPFLVLDGLRFRPHYTHFSIPQAIGVAQELRAGKTYLTHMSHSVDYESVTAELPPNIFLAYDGLEISFS